MRKKKKSELKPPQKRNQETVDLSKYNIVEDNFPKIYREYYGEVSDCILEFEKKYGDINGSIYIKQLTSGCIVGITGPQVKNNNGETA